MKVWEESITIDILDFKLFLKLSSVFSTSILLCYVFNIKMSFITVFKNKLLTKVDARTNGWRHENRCIKRPSHLWQYRSITLDFFLLVNAYVDIDQGIHLGKKGLNDRVKPSEVAGSFYATVFMAPSICSSIDFC